MAVGLVRSEPVRQHADFAFFRVKIVPERAVHMENLGFHDFWIWWILHSIIGLGMIIN